MSTRSFRIITARTAGFCMGVRRAVGMALGAADEPGHPRPIRTHGPLIHNRQVLQVLERRDVRTLADGERPEGGTVLVRAHGLAREEREALDAGPCAVLDATCPHVHRLQRIVQEQAARGYACIVVGDAGHAEVTGVLSYAGPAGYIVSGPDDVDALPPLDKVIVVAQTTQDEDLFRRTAARAQERFAECVTFDTVCRSTERRQTEARELAGRVDAMVVVGGYHSANTRRLADISRATGTPTFHVETERELDLEAVLQYGTVGLTAGASTPNWMLRRVVRRLEDEHLRRTALLRCLMRTFARGLVNSNLFAAGGTAALTYACALLLPVRPVQLGVCMAVSFFFVLSQHLLNQHGRRESLYLSEPDRADFFMANEGPLFALAVASSLLAIFLASFLGWWPFGLVAAGTAGGLAYRWPLPRVLGERLRLRSLEHVPGSKELFVGLAWGTLAGLVPALAAGGGPGQWAAAAVAFAIAFLLAYQRSLALDLRDVEGDQLVGRETLAGILGGRAARRVLWALAVLLGVVLALACLAGWTTGFCLPLLFCVPYVPATYVMLRRWHRREAEPAEILVDAGFYLLGAVGLVFGA
ncbi:MAG: 4-hydroxy-3-methylbut-2-enyl diphosphate reductase [Candidatus Brocadiaceae bacterium]|nr:4-hydroxy-3-methylbut-2-enyl diphosphate reductase [Candidatus Brocadiaceae bacterium]